MSNLKIFSVNLEKNYIINSRVREKRELLKEIINTNNYDVVMMQGGNLKVSNRENDYKELKSSNNLVTLYKDKFTSSVTGDITSDAVNGLVIYYNNRPLSIVNVNSSNYKSFQKLLQICEKYITLPYYVNSRIVSGVFPKDMDVDKFCKQFGLYDVTLPHTSQDEVNHFFISENLECEHIVSEDRMIETSLSYKKVLK